MRGMMEMGLSISEIVKCLGRHRSTIQRKLARNRSVDGYRPDSAERRAWARKLRGSRLGRSTRLRAHVEDRLAMGWSPEQIAGRMKLDGSEHTLSAESIYRHAYSPAGRRAGLPRAAALVAARADHSLHVRLHQDLQHRLGEVRRKFPSSAFCSASLSAILSSVIGSS